MIKNFEFQQIFQTVLGEHFWGNCGEQRSAVAQVPHNENGCNKYSEGIEKLGKNSKINFLLQSSRHPIPSHQPITGTDAH
jgi:hypothetical protein